MKSETSWTIETLSTHYEALREADLKFSNERDRRYTELTIEREKALKIKETADLAALSLARDIQIYKDEKANELREQINSERGLYATKNDLVAIVEKFDATLKPMSEYIAADRGKANGLSMSGSLMLGVVAVICALLTIGAFVFRASNTVAPVYTVAPVASH